jgi:Cu+-exporting ATPase
LQDCGATIIHVGGENGWIGAMAITDPLKPDARRAMAKIRNLGIEIRMLSGDDSRVVGYVAEQLGIVEYRGRVTPEGKKRLIEQWADEGRVIAMAGDGINDAPALATATVGIAMGNGTDVAMQSAEVTLVRGDLDGLHRAIQLGRATIRNIRQNLFFAFAYNGVGIPLAAGVLYPVFHVLLNPMFAALAMSLSSASVIGNALRLRSTPLDESTSSS